MLLIKALAEFLAEYKVEIIASMPCYGPDNVNAQRGDGVFDDSIQALLLLNKLGYGCEPDLPLNLVYNPLGPSLPPDQAELEADYKEAMQESFGIVFNNLYTITNMPIARFLAYLRREGKLQEYMELLAVSFNPQAIDGLMCRDTLNVDWLGRVYDCDFNQMLKLGLAGAEPPYLWEIDADSLEGREIAMANHCYGCAAGSGSSCGGAIA